MKPAVILSLIASVLGLQGAEAPQVPISTPGVGQVLATLKPGHPRLLMTLEDFARLRGQVATNAVLKPWYQRVVRNADALLRQAPAKYEIPDGLRLLATSRRVVDRVYTLALVYRLSGDKKYAERAGQELAAAAAFPDWNPRHFLDTAEMTHAFAVGYDWLYDVWTPEQRAVWREAMVEKGIKVAIECHRGVAPQRVASFWVKARHNWNQVCNGGIGMGALALADERPELASEFLAAALKSIQLAMVEYGPDGAWGEGPGYWGYATSYNVDFLAGLESALGTDFGLSTIAGFSEAGSFPIFAQGPTGKSFAYADAHEGRINAPCLFWLARKFHRPDYAAFQLKATSGSPLDMVWYDPQFDVSAAKSAPLDKYFRGPEVVTLRSAWADPSAVFVAFKAGDNKANHSHLDLGTFTLDAMGTRWATDLGSDDYNMPAYFGNQRWTYYRLRAEGHNTLVLNPGQEADQDPKAAARVIQFQTSPRRAFGIADLTPAYARQASQVRRGVALLERNQVLVQDEVRFRQPGDFWWFLHTEARVELEANGQSAVLSQDAKKMRVQILSPTEARFTVMDARPLPTSPDPSMQAKNNRVRKLAVHLTPLAETRLAIVFSPITSDSRASAELPKVTPLSMWTANP
jgi:hypothetical protein